MTNISILRHIRAQDPDGHGNEPTKRELARFKGWVIKEFGEQAWEDYHTDWEIGTYYV